jgi:rhodanese-related sulfurtransferase
MGLFNFQKTKTRATKVAHVLLLLVMGCLAVSLASAQTSTPDLQQLPSTKRSVLGLYLYSKDVPAFLAKFGGRTLFIDVRHVYEAMEQGAPSTLDAVIPFDLGYAHETGTGSKAGTPTVGYFSFIAAVDKLATEKKLGKNAPVILISNHGERSAAAASMLAWHGYGLVYSVVDGYQGDHVANKDERNNGWHGNRLPTIYKAEALPLRYAPSPRQQ